MLAAVRGIPPLLLTVALLMGCSEHHAVNYYVFAVAAAQPAAKHAVHRCATDGVRASEDSPGVFSVLGTGSREPVDTARQCVERAGLKPGPVHGLTSR